ncbi:TIGR03943 family putative permease subunit [Streptomyces phaeofaciens]|uniref:TIGR03943 family putative permease subunit n=1 Tax=Streptomyces phaeofaciens TaxID=68254 RepID=UPI0036C7DF6C
MKRWVKAGLLGLGGLGLLRTALFTDEYLRYVKEGMRPLLIASGVLLVALGVAEAWSVSRRGPHGAPGHGHDDGHRHGSEGDRGSEEGHDHSGVPRVAWLLVLPALSLLFHAPPALGSYTASREPARTVAVQDEDDFDPLPATSPLPITMTDFTQRVQQDRKRAIEGRAVLMSGFVTPAPDGEGGWYLTRILVSCCAADATTLKVRVYGIAAPKADTWVSVTGTWHASGALGTSSAAVAVDARSVTKIGKPSNSYMDALPLTS